MNKYTVLLVIPDYAAQAYGQDQLIYRVEADNVFEAARKAKILAAQDSNVNIPADFYCPWIFEGHIAPLCWGEPDEGDAA